MPRVAVWTVGHSSHSLETFCQLLLKEGIEQVVDVRSYPYSRFVPHFDRELLGRELGTRGITYEYAGAELGGRPVAAHLYDEEGRALYDLMSREAKFQDAVDRLLRSAETQRLALLCSEGDPTDCHRRLLVGKVLTDHRAELRHIYPDGSVRLEHEVFLSSDPQTSLLEEGLTWRSTRSVSQRRRLDTSSIGSPRSG
jgi:uncharacterized protein (DUF488 family)